MKLNLQDHYLYNICKNWKLTDEISQVSVDMDTMIGITEGSIAEINRVNKSGGNGTAIFIRKEAKKVAKGIDTFASKFHVRTKTISSLWDEIEKNTLGMLENEIATNDNNRQQLITYLSALYNTI